MKAARWYAAKDIRVEETEIPSPKKNQVKIEVKFTGICGSDLHEYLHGPLSISMDKPFPLTGHNGITTLGHEFSGVVAEIGEGVKNINIGDRVVIEPMYRNPDSPYLLTGKYNLSEPSGFIGFNSNGGFAKYTIAEDYMVHKIPDSMTFEEGAVVEPAAVAVQAVHQSELKIGQSCVIFGAGPIGLLTVLAAIAAGASKIIVVDVAEKRLEKAKEIGANHVINGKSENIPQQIQELTNGGADISFDAAGVQASFNNAVASVKKGGTIVLIAIYGRDITHNASAIVIKEITLKGTIAYRNIFPKVISLIDSGIMPVNKLITSKIKLDNIVSEGFEALISSPKEVKIIVDVNQ